VEAAIAGGIELLGITDHNYGVGFGLDAARHAPVSVVKNSYGPYALRRYFDHIDLIKEKYADKIKILRGIEIATTTRAEVGKVTLPENADVSFFDYCLIEHLDYEDSMTRGDLFSFAERCGCAAVGVAHTDLFAHAVRMGEEPYRYFRRMAERNIFWEMNVSYDSTHHYREHSYMLDFFKSSEQQDIIRRAGVRVSIGFDGHKVEDYYPERIIDFNRRLDSLGIKKVFED
jgi:histidinol phosphatase-like PHP family hydrolase